MEREPSDEPTTVEGIMGAAGELAARWHAYQVELVTAGLSAPAAIGEARTDLDESRAALEAAVSRIVEQRDEAMIDAARLASIINILRASHVSARAAIREMPTAERDELLALLRRRTALTGDQKT